MPFQQQVTRLLAEIGIADHHRHDMSVGSHHWEAGLRKRRFRRGDSRLLVGALDLGDLQMRDGRRRCSRYSGWQGGREDEAWRMRAHRIDHGTLAGDIAAEGSERLGEGAFDHVDAVHHVVALSNAGPARAVHADRMDLVNVGHGVVALGQITDPGDWRDVAVHRIDALEYDQLWPVVSSAHQQLFQMSDVVVAPDQLGAAGGAHALDHRVVVERIGKDETVRQQPCDGRDAGKIRHIAECEDQGRLLAMQVGEFVFERDDRPVGA